MVIPPKPASTEATEYSISIYAGNNHSNAAGTLSSTAFVAQVTDQNGRPQASVAMSWSVGSGGGSLAGQSLFTNSQGLAFGSLIFGSTPGANTVTASIAGSSKSVTFTGTGIVGPASAVESTITGSSPVEPDGVSASVITITLKDQYENLIVGTTPTFSATGSNNTYGACSASNASGVSTCTLRSTTTETKILSLLTPVATIGGTVVFAPGPVAAANSTITGTGPVTADGTSTSTITITLKDAANVAVSGITPTFSATDTGGTNSYGACSTTNVSGVSTCTLSSTRAETKTLTITSPVFQSDGSVIFEPGSASTTTSTITGTGPTENDGTSTSTITITLLDTYSNPISGTTPTFSATGSTNTYGACSSTDASGVSTCTLASTTAETKTLSITSPISKSGGTVVFAPGPVVAANSTITGTGPVTADGTSTSTITITLRDASNIPVGGVTPTFSATNTGSTNVYGACSVTNSSGVSTCTLSSTRAQTKTLTITSPVNKSDGTVVFQAGAISAVTSTITGSGPITANGTSTSTITITLRDVNSNAVSGTVPTFSATDTGLTNVYTGCSSSNASGVSTCTLKSTKAETKTLSIATPIVKVGGTVVFQPGAADTTYSTITGTGPVSPDGSSTSTVSIYLYDAYNNPISGTTPTFTATNTGSTNVYGACSSSSAVGLSTCTLASSQSETKTLSIATPIVKVGGTVVFTPGAASSTFSSITGTGSVVANGIATSTITITLKDASNVALQGVVPTFTATNTGNTNMYSACSATDSNGVSTCALASQKAEIKTLQISSPLSMSGGTVTFVAGTPSASTSMITGTGPITADGSSTSTVTMVVYDAYNNPVSGITPTFSATDTGSTNSYGACSATDATGASTCTLSSQKAEVKTLSITSPVSVAGGTVAFVAGAAAAANSTIVGTGSVGADGTSTSTVTITLQDTFGNPISGTTPTFSATDTGGTNSYGACSSSTSAGVSTCTLSSLRAETKTLSIATPVAKAGGSVVFTQVANAANSSITGTGPVPANGNSTSDITITLRDYSNIAITGVTPTFSATDTGGDNIYSACTATDGTGVSTCTLKSNTAETKTLNVTSPVSFSDGTVDFF